MTVRSRKHSGYCRPLSTFRILRRHLYSFTDSRGVPAIYHRMAGLQRSSSPHPAGSLGQPALAALAGVAVALTVLR